MRLYSNGKGEERSQIIVAENHSYDPNLTMEETDLQVGSDLLKGTQWICKVGKTGPDVKQHHLDPQLLENQI